METKAGWFYKYRESYGCTFGSILPNLPVCVATEPSSRFMEPGCPTHRNWLFRTDLLTNRIAQTNTKHHEYA